MARKKRKAPEPIERLDVTPERAARNDVESAGMARRIVPVIDTLFKSGKLTERQHKALGRYADIVAADRGSPIKDSVTRLIEGRVEGGGGMPISTFASIERGYLERELGQLRDIAYAIAFENMTPSQWAMQQTGSIERRRQQGKREVVWFEPRRKALQIAMLEIRFAGERLAAAIAA